MKIILFALLCFQLSGVWAQKSTSKPNVVFIICDQMRADAFGAAGNDVVNTPNIDMIANEGVMFTQAYANNPVCLPSRMSFFSGQYPNSTGVYGNYPNRKWLAFEKSLPWYFKEAGYEIGYVGKNHAFIKDDMNSFDTHVDRGREKCRAYNNFVPPNWHSDIFWPEEDCNPAKNAKDAVEFINYSSSDKPFFLTVSLFDPHPPYMAPARVSSKYCSSDMQVPEFIDPKMLSPRLEAQQKALLYDKQTVEDIKETMRYYYAAVEWGVDEQLGAVMNALRAKGIVDNTIVVFISDHGDFMGEYNMVRKAMFMYDALLHVPMIWYAPNHIEKGLKIEDLAQCVDIFPTLMDLAGLSIPDELEGKSLTPMLKGHRVAVNDYVFAAASYSELPSNYWDNPEPYYKAESEKPFHSRVEALTWKEDKKTAMVRTKDWKLIVSETQAPELYHMNGKNIERQNLYGEEMYNDICLELKSIIHQNWDYDFMWGL